MTIPIIITGHETGQLHIRTEGLYTLMEAKLPPSEKLLRLWLHGEGESFALGLLEPGKDGQYLRRRYTRNQLRTLPPNIDFASDCPCRGDLYGRPRARSSLAPTAVEPSPWHTRPDGTLIDPVRRLVALPCALRRPAAKTRIIRINDREYMVFRY